MKKIIPVIFGINILCIIWMTFLATLAPARLKPMEAMIANDKHDEIVPFGIEVVKSLAYQIYMPVLIVLILNMMVIYAIKTNRGEV